MSRQTKVIHKMKTKKNIYGSLFEKPQELHVSLLRHFVAMLTKEKSSLFELLPGKGSLINEVWKRSYILLYLAFQHPKTLGRRISSMREFPRGNKVMIFKDKLNSYGPQIVPFMLPMMLLRILHQELISKEKDYVPFWNTAYEELSKNLLLPIVTDSVDLVSNSLNSSWNPGEGNSPWLVKKQIPVQKPNLQTTYFPLSTSTAAAKWAAENIKEKETTMKSIQIRLIINPVNNIFVTVWKRTKSKRWKRTKKKKVKRTINPHKEALNDWFDTTRYVYNKTIASIRNGFQINEYKLRDMLVTLDTKKTDSRIVVLDAFLEEQQKRIKEIKTLKTIDEEEKKQQIENIQNIMKPKKDEKTELYKTIQPLKNNEISTWELKTPKATRQGAVSEVVSAYKAALTNLKRGNIQLFEMKFRKKTCNHQSLLLDKQSVTIQNGIVRISPTMLKENAKFGMGKRTQKKYGNLEITQDCRLVKRKKEYWLHIPVKVECKQKSTFENYCGIDPGPRTFMTVFGNTGCIEYQQNMYILKKLHNQHDKIRLQTSKELFLKPPKKPSSKRQRKSRQSNKMFLKRRILENMESRERNLINELHWNTISNLLKTNDLILYGDIKSHNIVKGRKSRKLNEDMNSLKFYQFKEKMKYKAKIAGVRVFEVKEPFTTQTCSFCGCMYKPGKSKVYHCESCHFSMGRDVNASKNILMKGLIENEIYPN